MIVDRAAASEIEGERYAETMDRFDFGGADAGHHLLRPDGPAPGGRVRLRARPLDPAGQLLPSGGGAGACEGAPGLGDGPHGLPLWADPADQEAAATAVEEWEKAEEERKRLEEEQKRLEEERARAEAEAAAQAQAQGETSSPSASSSASAAPAEQTTPAPDASGGGETAPAAGETETAQSQEGTSSAQTGTDPAQPGETPAAETPAVQEPAPETPADTPDPSGSAETPAAEPQTPAETEPVEEEEPPTLTDGALALVASGTPFTVLREEGGWWQVAVTPAGWSTSTVW